MFAICVSVIVPGGRAAAQQDRIPSIAIERSTGSTGGAFLPQEAPGFNYNNDYMNDTFQLQYQIGLLQRMVQRQNSISRLEKTYLDLGRYYPSPPPPRGICQQIPINIPCFQAYPDLYDVVLPAVTQLDPDDFIEYSGTEGVDIEPVSLRQQPSPEPVWEGPQEKYRWAEVVCGAGKCSAVLVETDNPGSRKTVHVGDRFAEDYIVSAISWKGVSLQKAATATAGTKKDAQDQIKLSPALAPGRGGTSSPRFAAGGPAAGQERGAAAGLADNPFERTGQLADIFGNDDAAAGVVPSLSGSPAATNGQARLNVQQLPVDTDQGIGDPGPALGPTGLF